MMKLAKRTGPLVIAFVIWGYAAFGTARTRDQVEISGTIVAVNVASTIANLYENFDSPYRHMVFVVRLEGNVSKTEEQKYAIIHYISIRANFKLLPDEIRNGQQAWRVRITRNKECDEKLQDMLYVKAVSTDGKKTNDILNLIRNDAGKNDNLPLDSLLPCYETERPDY
jgi:hypothetical protein